MSANHSRTEQTSPLQFDLQTYFPYIIRVFYTDVSSAVGETYQEKYDLSPAEWRCMAILNGVTEMTAAEIVAVSSMDKVTVSRAISRLRVRDWIVESANHQDRRSKLVRLSGTGRAILSDLIPKVLKVQDALLANIDDAELDAFLATLEKITANRKTLSASADLAEDKP